MKIKNCEYDLETKFVEACDSCRKSRFKRRIPVRIGNYILYVTYQYEIRNCFMGFTSGDFLYAMSLLPKEEQEVEIVQKAKYERSLHEQRSVESEFEHEFMNTFRMEVEASHDVNTSASVEGGVDFFDIVKAGASGSVSTASHFGSKLFNETVVKASMKVSNHYDVSIDTKTEMENHYRSLRKISNPNNCRVVTFFFKQLNKKYRFEVALVDIRFDLILQLPKIHQELLPYYSIERRYAVAVRQPAVLRNENPAELSESGLVENLQLKISGAGYNALPKYNYLKTDRFIQLAPREIEIAKELEYSELILKLESSELTKEHKAGVIKTIKDIISDKNNQPEKVIYKAEYCLRTNSIITEPKVSSCSICTCDTCDCEEKEITP